MPGEVAAVSQKLECRWAPGCPLMGGWVREGGPGDFKACRIRTPMRHGIVSMARTYTNETYSPH